MEIVIWITVVIGFSLLLGECYYQYLNKKKEKHNMKIIEISDESEEYKMDKLNIESFDLISRRKLQMRGSWRLAKDNIMSHSHFKSIRDNEYKKML